MRILIALLLAVAAHAETWEGEFRTPRWPTYVSIDIDGSAGALRVLGRTFPITAVQRDGDTLRVTAGDAATIEGRVSGDAWTGTLKSGVESFPIALARVPAYPAPENRVEGWTQDLDALEQRFLKFDRSFSDGERARFREDIGALRADLAKLDDAQVILRIASAVALARNAHTRLYLLRNRTELRRFPIRLWWFRDGLYVVRATPPLRHLLGCRVDAFDGTPSRYARDIVSAAFAGNAPWRDYKSVYFLTSPEALHGFGITRDADRVTIDVSGCTASRATIEALPLEKKSKPVEAWWDLSPAMKDPDREWVHVLAQTPSYLRNPDRNYWFEYLPDDGLLYFHYSRASDAADENTKAFGARLLAQFDEHPVKGFVLDLRFNTGGDETIARDLMTRLQEKTKTMPRFVITGRATFSAGISHAVSWRAEPGVTFAGEPVGDELDIWSEGGNIVLPSSKLYAHFANGAHNESGRVSTLQPDVPVMMTWDEYVAGKDPAMEAVRNEMRKRK